MGKRSPPAEVGCCASRQEENGRAMEGNRAEVILTPTNLGNRVQKEFLIFVELVFFFFVFPWSWIDTAVVWSSSWASPTYQAVWETAQGEGGRGNPPIPLSLLCTVRCTGQLTPYGALLGVTAGGKQLFSVGKAGLDNCT